MSLLAQNKPPDGGRKQMKRIGLMVAVESEVVTEAYGKPKTTEQVGSFVIDTYKRGFNVIYLLHSGVGEIAAAAAAQLLISVYHVDLIFNVGVVGGLTEEMALGKLGLVKSVVHYAMDVSAIDGLKVGQYSEYPDIYIPADQALFDKALAVSDDLIPAVCASADRFVSGKEDKAYLRETFGADICDMESAGILLTCNRNKVPCVMLKAVSDAMEGTGEEFYAFWRRSMGEAVGILDRILEAVS